MDSSDDEGAEPDRQTDGNAGDMTAAAGSDFGLLPQSDMERNQNVRTTLQMVEAAARAATTPETTSLPLPADIIADNQKAASYRERLDHPLRVVEGPDGATVQKSSVTLCSMLVELVLLKLHGRTVRGR